MQKELIQDYETEYSRITGKDQTLAEIDEIRFLLYAVSVQHYQTILQIDKNGKMNLLKYSFGDFVDCLAAWKNITRNPAKSATIKVRFVLAEIQENTITIPIGTRVAAQNIFFETTEIQEIPAGEESIIVEMTCTETGEIGNAINKIDTLVDFVPYVTQVENQTISSGGTEQESDESLLERIYLAPSRYSTAGAEEAYKYWIKTYNQDIIDVKVTSTEPTTVDIRFILKNGILPDANIIDGLKNYITGKDKRPLTDKVMIAAPDIVPYTISLEYWINKSDINKSITIQKQVLEAIQTYKNWQSSTIGMDINPDELIMLIKKAGAKRVLVHSPVFTIVNDTSIAFLDTTEEIFYRGLEDD